MEVFKAVLTSWGPKEARNLDHEASIHNLRSVSNEALLEIFFEALRTANISAIRNILRMDKNLLRVKLYGYEGADVYQYLKEFKVKRCYTYTGSDKDGYFYPLHVAAEYGHKELVHLIVQSTSSIGASAISDVDYRGDTPEQKANGKAKEAFYELHGLKLESMERFSGTRHRTGQKRQGELFRKDEGYKEKEYLVYRGSFKKDLFHGHGTSYFPHGESGKEVIQYSGRFHTGDKHGRGTEFNIRGMMLYQGSFRRGKKDGAGVEFEDNADTGYKMQYKGEFFGGLRHGFGMAVLAAGHVFLGRFVNAAMCGIGIYCQQNQRFEGTFFENKPDGPGSLYTIDPITGEVINAIHAVWDRNKIVRNLDSPFEPSDADLPDLRDQMRKFAQTNDKMNEVYLQDGRHNKEDVNIERLSLDDKDEDENVELVELPTIDELSWQEKLMIHIRVTTTEAVLLGLILPKNVVDPSPELKSVSATIVNRKNSNNNSLNNSNTSISTNGTITTNVGSIGIVELSGMPGQTTGIKQPPSTSVSLGQQQQRDREREKKKSKPKPKTPIQLLLDTMEEESMKSEEQESNDAEELGGAHFKGNPVIYSAYCYVTSAANMFESRLKSDAESRQKENIDFENVYQLVIDAVEMYNDGWESEMRRQIEPLQTAKPIRSKASASLAVSTQANTNSNSNTTGAVDTATLNGVDSGIDNGGTTVDATVARNANPVTEPIIGNVPVSSPSPTNVADINNMTPGDANIVDTPSSDLGGLSSLVGQIKSETERKISKQEAQRAELKRQRLFTILDPVVETRLGLQTVTHLEDELKDLIFEPHYDNDHGIVDTVPESNSHLNQLSPASGKGSWSRQQKFKQNYQFQYDEDGEDSDSMQDMQPDDDVDDNSEDSSPGDSLNSVNGQTLRSVDVSLASLLGRGDRSQIKEKFKHDDGSQTNDNNSRKSRSKHSKDSDGNKDAILTPAQRLKEKSKNAFLHKVHQGVKEQERIDDSLNHIARNEFAAELLYIIQRAEDFCTISKSNTYDENGDPLSSLGMSLVQGPK